MSKNAEEIESGERFAFGENWAHFLRVLNDARIEQAEYSLKAMLEVQDLRGKCFLDVGSGSGLFSLAAKRLGAKVHSFDYDSRSVACTRELKRRYFPDDPQWIVEEGSVLDSNYLRDLGQFDVVYSWGVLHHTGAMWQALENVVQLVCPKAGQLFIAIYNDQGGWSGRWRAIKKIFNLLPSFMKLPYSLLVITPRELRYLFLWCIRGRPDLYFKNISIYAQHSLRGMSYWHDCFDWVGGYPFEVAKPEEIFAFYRKKGFHLNVLKTCGGGLGCNEYIFTREKKYI